MIEFGPPIEVNGVRPEWLSDEPVAADLRLRGVWQFTHDERETSPLVWAWGAIDAIKLPITHPHYTKDTAMTDDEIIAKGFKPFHGNEQPADFDDSRSVLFGNGAEYGGDREWCWSPERHPSDTIIGYHPKEPTKPTRIVIPDGPAEEWALKRWDEIFMSSAMNGYRSVGAKLVVMLEQPPVDPVEELAKQICIQQGFSWNGGAEHSLALAGIRAGIEMGKGEV